MKDNKDKKSRNEILKLFKSKKKELWNEYFENLQIIIDDDPQLRFKLWDEYLEKLEMFNQAFNKIDKKGRTKIFKWKYSIKKANKRILKREQFEGKKCELWNEYLENLKKLHGEPIQLCFKLLEEYLEKLEKLNKEDGGNKIYNYLWVKNVNYENLQKIIGDPQLCFKLLEEYLEKLEKLNKEDGGNKIYNLKKIIDDPQLCFKLLEEYLEQLKELNKEDGEKKNEIDQKEHRQAQKKYGKNSFIK